jgi:hypothetical protein
MAQVQVREYAFHLVFRIVERPAWRCSCQVGHLTRRLDRATRAQVKTDAGRRRTRWVVPRVIPRVGRRLLPDGVKPQARARCVAPRTPPGRVRPRLPESGGGTPRAALGACLAGSALDGPRSAHDGSRGRPRHARHTSGRYRRSRGAMPSGLAHGDRAGCRPTTPRGRGIQARSRAARWPVPASADADEDARAAHRLEPRPSLSARCRAIAACLHAAPAEFLEHPPEDHASSGADM